VREVWIIKEIHLPSSLDLDPIDKKINEELSEQWEDVRRKIKEEVILKLNPSKVKLYRDSLTDVDDFIRETKQGRHPSVFKDLLDWGVKPVRTELELFIYAEEDLGEELKWLEEILKNLPKAKKAPKDKLAQKVRQFLFKEVWKPELEEETKKHPDKYQSLFIKAEKILKNPKIPLSLMTKIRDRYVALRVAETLEDGETGLLFMGAIHQVEKSLKKIAPDIKVKLLLEMEFPPTLEKFFKKIGL